MKSALMRPPPRRVLDPRAAREAEVAALAHDLRAQLARVDADASEERSAASASVSVEALTTVPMPPFHSRSTGARRIARMTSVGASDSSSIPSAARACSDSRIDLAARGYTPPPSEIFSRS